MNLLLINLAVGYPWIVPEISEHNRQNVIWYSIKDYQPANLSNYVFDLLEYDQIAISSLTLKAFDKNGLFKGRIFCNYFVVNIKQFKEQYEHEWSNT